MRLTYEGALTLHVFITGVAGFLGSHLADAFLARGCRVSGIDNLIGGYRDNVPKGVTFYDGDLNDLDYTASCMAEVDVVYHTACTAYEGLSVFSPSLVCRNTVQISVNVMTAALKKRVKRFVHCSSMARYGEQPFHPFTEDMVCRPQDPYGIAKYSSELLLKNMAQTHGIELVIAVPHNIVGSRQKYNDPFRNVASIMTNMMLQGRQPIIYGDGSQIRCFSDIRDDVDCLVKFVLDDDACGDIFNVGPDEEPITIISLAEKIANQLRFNLEPVYLAGRPQEVKFATCSAKKIRSRFGYSTKYTIDDTISSLIEYIESRGPLPFEYHLPIEIVSELTPKAWTEKLF